MAGSTNFKRYMDEAREYQAKHSTDSGLIALTMIQMHIDECNRKYNNIFRLGLGIFVALVPLALKALGMV